MRDILEASLTGNTELLKQSFLKARQISGGLPSKETPSFLNVPPLTWNKNEKKKSHILQNTIPPVNFYFWNLK